MKTSSAFWFLLLPLWFPCLAVTATTITVYSTLPEDENNDAAAVARKQKYDLTNYSRRLNKNNVVSVQYLNAIEQQTFVDEKCHVHTADWDSLSLPLQQELFKWCALSTTDDAYSDLTVVLDPHSPILNVNALTDLWEKRDNVAVVDEDNHVVHGSYIQMRSGGGPTSSRQVAKSMLQVLMETDRDLLHAHALLIPKKLRELITTTTNKDDWFFLSLVCRKDTKKEHESRSHLMCPASMGYCCSVQDQVAGSTVLLSRHYVLPYQSIPEQGVPLPYNSAKATPDDRPFVSTVSVKELPATSHDQTPNFYDILAEKNCLPGDDKCAKCLREKKGANCKTCAKECSCYCSKLCQTDIPTKRIAQEWTVTPPHYSKDPERLIPRIVHQTYFEELTAEDYPNMSRLVESFKRAGWDYRFYSDDDAMEFLETHFPPAVLEAYNAMKPGAFKADLFRYCVLLITGGIYADVDIQLESALDISIPPDVGFMVPVDEPGKPVHKQMCLWNGLIAAAPGHPFLAKAIETVVNQVRNRFTSVDIDATFCPNPELSVLHAYDTLFTAGPCLLGSSLNRVLGRNGQSSHIPGEIHGLWSGEQRQRTLKGTSFVHGVDDDKQLEQHRLPGRTIILHQNKWDMGAHRFTFLEQNLVIAATDLPDSNDRETEQKVDKEHEHYSKTHAKTGVYGVELLYIDQERANEDIRILIDASMHAKKQAHA